VPNGGISWGPAIEEIVEGVWTRVTRELTNLSTTRAEKIDRLDALISSRADGTDYTADRAVKLDKLDAVISSRQPDAGLTPTHVNRIDANISSRQVDAGLTPTHVGRLDAAISTRASADDYTPARATKLDNLDALVSSRATEAGIWSYVTRKLNKATSLVYAILSDNLKVSADTERSEGSGVNTKVKEMQIIHAGNYRIKYDIRKHPDAGSAVAQVFKDGIEYGARYTSYSDTYETVTEDLSFNAGDLVQLYLHTTSAGKDAYIRNFRLYFDYHDDIERVPIITVD